MTYLIALVVLALVVGVVVLRPLRRGARVERRDHRRRADLEAAREAKYREIRDTQLDLRMGKISEDDFHATDTELRGQAIVILRELDALGTEEKVSLSGKVIPSRKLSPSR